jgi:hypothetical protein
MNSGAFLVEREEPQKTVKTQSCACVSSIHSTFKSRFFLSNVPGHASLDEELWASQSSSENPLGGGKVSHALRTRMHMSSGLS